MKSSSCRLVITFFLYGLGISSFHSIEAHAEYPCGLKTESVYSKFSQIDSILALCLPKFEQQHSQLFPASTPKSTRIIEGRELQGTPDELDILERILGENSPDNRVPAKRLPAKWKETKTCKNVLCVLSALFGDEESAYRVLNIAKRTGYILSADERYKPMTAWNAKRVREIDEALMKLP
ncbi:MAG: hypothetical protein Q7U04_12065, partial [Bacteriovorax sp.]|nr:hypothetical protein [Bacteriovorax sp.]